MTRPSKIDNLLASILAVSLAIAVLAIAVELKLVFMPDHHLASFLLIASGIALTVVGNGAMFYQFTGKLVLTWFAVVGATTFSYAVYFAVSRALGVVEPVEAITINVLTGASVFMAILNLAKLFFRTSPGKNDAQPSGNLSE